MFERILVPLDGSHRAEQVLPVAARLAQASGGSIHLLQVLNPLVDYGGLAPVPMVTEQSTEQEMNQSIDYLDTVAASPVLTGIQTTTEVLFGVPARQILTVAEEQRMDLIVVCSHGRSGLTRWALGSVAHQLIRHSAIPVLLLHPEAQVSSMPLQKIQGTLNVMVPLDGSLVSEEALRPAALLSAQISHPQKGMLHLVSVLPQNSMERITAIERKQAMQHAQDYLAGIKQRLLQQEDFGPRLSITTSVTIATDIAHSLVEHAEMDKDSEQGKASARSDVIIMATHGRGGIAHWIIGSVAERVLETTKLPLLVVRPHKISAHLDEEKRSIAQKNEVLERHTESSWVGLL